MVGRFIPHVPPPPTLTPNPSRPGLPWPTPLFAPASCPGNRRDAWPGASLGPCLVPGHPCVRRRCMSKRFMLTSHSFLSRSSGRRATPLLEFVLFSSWKFFAADVARGCPHRPPLSTPRVGGGVTRGQGSSDWLRDLPARPWLGLLHPSHHGPSRSPPAEAQESSFCGDLETAVVIATASPGEGQRDPAAHGCSSERGSQAAQGSRAAPAPTGVGRVGPSPPLFAHRSRPGPPDLRDPRDAPQRDGHGASHCVLLTDALIPAPPASQHLVQASGFFGFFKKRKTPLCFTGQIGNDFQIFSLAPGEARGRALLFFPGRFLPKPQPSQCWGLVPASGFVSPNLIWPLGPWVRPASFLLTVSFF